MFHLVKENNFFIWDRLFSSSSLIWSSNASDMMEEIHDYISQFGFKAADKYIEGIYNSVARLEAHPESCALAKTLN